MSEQLADFVNEHSFSVDVLEEAARTLLSEEIGDPTAAEMRAQLASTVPDEETLNAALRWLEQNPPAIESAATAWLAESWNESSDRVRSAIEDASTAMPVLEIGASAVTAMYIAWLLTTRGKASAITATPLQPIARLFR